MYLALYREVTDFPSFSEGLLLRTHALSETGVYYEMFSLYQERLALRHNVAAPTVCIAAGYSLPIRRDFH